jgi:hypothetical protein
MCSFLSQQRDQDHVEAIPETVYGQVGRGQSKPQELKRWIRATLEEDEESILP